MALSELRNCMCTDIIIKKADKGSSVVILNRKDYIQEGLKQLNDNKFCIKTRADLTNQHNNEIAHTRTNARSKRNIIKNFLYLTELLNFICNQKYSKEYPLPQGDQLYPTTTAQQKGSANL